MNYPATLWRVLSAEYFSFAAINAVVHKRNEMSCRRNQLGKGFRSTEPARQNVRERSKDRLYLRRRLRILSDVLLVFFPSRIELTGCEVQNLVSNIAQFGRHLAFAFECEYACALAFRRLGANVMPRPSNSCLFSSTRLICVCSGRFQLFYQYWSCQAPGGSLLRRFLLRSPRMTKILKIRQVPKPTKRKQRALAGEKSRSLRLERSRCRQTGPEFA